MKTITGSRRGFIFVLLAAAAIAFGQLAVTAAERTVVPGAEAQERVAELIQSVLGPYRAENVITNGSTNTSSITYTNIEASFREASKLMPNRLDLRFGIGSALIGQALQTNTQFEVKMKEALKVYQEIHAMDRSGFQAQLLSAAYARAIGQTNASESGIAQLMGVHPARTRAYLEKFRRVDEILQIVPNEKVAMPMSPNHAI